MSSRGSKRQRQYASSSYASSSSSKPFYNPAAVPRIQKKLTQAQLNQRIQGLIGIETKFFDLHKGTTSIDDRSSHANHSPDTQGCLNSVSAGDGPSERDGRKFTMKSIHINGAILMKAGTNADANNGSARILIVMDTQTNKVKVTELNEILSNVSGADAGLNVYNFRNLSGTSRFKILYDKTYVINSNYAQSDYQKNFKININLKDAVCNMTTAGNDVTGILDNSIHFFAISDTPQTQTVGTPAFRVEYISRLRFVG